MRMLVGHGRHPRLSPKLFLGRTRTPRAKLTPIPSLTQSATQSKLMVLSIGPHDTIEDVKYRIQCIQVN